MKPWPLFLHVNYFEQGPTLQDACRIAKEYGADGVEFRQFPNAYPGTWRDYLDEVSRALDSYPLKEVSFGWPGPNLMAEDAATRDRSLQNVIEFYQAASRRVSVKTVNAFTGTLLNPDKSLRPVDYWHHGSAIASEHHWAQAAEGLKNLAGIAEELHLTFALETHGFYLHDSIESAVKLADAVGSPNIGVLWDQANLMIFRSTLSMSQAIATLGGHLRYVHLKNHLLPPAVSLQFSGLRDGIINIREQLRLLNEAGYEGPICMESPRDGDRLVFLKEDFAYLTDILQDCGRR